MGRNTNPLVGETTTDTLEAVAESLQTLAVLLAHQHSGLVRLLEPLQAALDYEVERCSSASSPPPSLPG